MDTSNPLRDPLRDPLRAALVAEMDQEMLELQPKLDMLTTIESDKAAAGAIANAVILTSNATARLLQDLKAVISTVRMSLTGTDTDRCAKVSLLYEVMSGVVNMTLLTLKAISELPTTAIERCGYKVAAQFTKQISELVAAGNAVPEAILLAIKELPISDSEKEAVRKECQDYYTAHISGGSDESIASPLDNKVPINTANEVTAAATFIDDIVTNNLNVVWKDEWPSTMLSANSVFNDSLLQVADVTSSTQDTAINLIGDVMFGSGAVTPVELATRINNVARSIFLADKEPITLAIVAITKDVDGKPREGFCIVNAEPGMRDDKSKAMLHALLRAITIRYSSDVVIMILETWLVKRPLGLEEPRPAEALDRTEALLVTANLKTGKSVCIVNDILRGTSNVSLGKPVIIETDLPNECSGYFSNFW